ncbi:MAG: LPS export ABC transporter permease LptG [Burkholderiales bacterium]|nr:LPS export ABC transporter permease LptG [Burkholderiales bacterium]
MKTVRRFLYGQIITTVGFVALSFMALFFFIDFVDALQDVGRHGYTLANAAWTCVLAQPSHLYDMFPIALLIGATLALARLAQSSEFTILRTAGLGPARALNLLGGLGIAAALLMFGVGDWLMPLAEQQASLHRAGFSQGQGLKLGRGGAWLRERNTQTDGSIHTVTVNVGAAEGQDRFRQVRVFEFDAQGQLVRRVVAQQARIEAIGDGATGSVWQLQGVTDTQWLARPALPNEAASLDVPGVNEQQVARLDWRSSLTPLVVAASVLPPDTMSTVSLWRYTQHLAHNAQAAQRYEIQFWKRATSPLVCLVMLALALPFAYLHTRGGGMSLKIFGGIMLGISFVLVNHISSHLGLLHQWQPWVAAAMPSLVYLLLSLSTFVWLVRNR